MSRNYGMAGVGYGKGFNDNGECIINTKSLTTSGFNATTTLEEIRGGEGHALQVQYPHTSTFTANLQDALISIEMVQLQVGGVIKSGGEVFANETCEVKNGKITVKGTPVEWNKYGYIGWYSFPKDIDNSTPFYFTGKEANISGVVDGTSLCVVYVISNDSARTLEVASNFMPSIIHLRYTMPLLSVTNGGEVAESSTKVGEWVVDIPRFQLDGSIDLSTTSSGSVGGTLSGKALSSGALTCEGKQIYATITENLYNTDKMDKAVGIIIDEQDGIELSVGNTELVKVYARYADRTPLLLNNSEDLIMTSSSDSVATISTDGLITAVSTGTATIEVISKKKANLISTALVTIV